MDFDKLYNTYYMEVYSYVMTLIRNSHLAEEITQEAFFKAIKTKKQYNGKSSEFTWLCAIAKHTCIDELRKQARLKEFNEEIPSTICVEKMFEDKHATLQIHQVLHVIEEPYKEIFQLRIFGELSFQTIGQIFGKTETWARVTYHRARLKIQERMEHYE